MTKRQTAIVLLKMLTKRNYKNKLEKEYLKREGYVSENGNVTVQGKDAAWDYYG